MAVGRTNVGGGAKVVTFAGATGSTVAVTLGYRPVSVKLQYNAGTYDGIISYDSGESPYSFYTPFAKNGSPLTGARGTFITPTDTGFNVTDTTTGIIYRCIAGK